ncbi:integral membrane sensor signal transduction histidine kinase [Bacillus sp. B-jedd]|nr:integral membrane sensor signal transduction histidine kinase [Bacillus sp. B-jedd]
MVSKMKRWIYSQPIRNKVLAFGILMSSIPLLLLSLYYFIHTKAELEDRINERQNLVLLNLSNEIELEFNQTFQHLQMLSVLSESANSDTGYYELLDQNESIEEIVRISETGNAEKRVSRYNLNLVEPNEKWFTDNMWKAFQTEEKIYGQVEFNQFGQPIMKLAVPYSENGKRKGYGAVVQLQKLIGKISSQRQDNDSYLYLLDKNGKVIAHQDYSRLWSKNPVANSRSVLGVEEHIPGLGWTLVMEQPKEAAYFPIKEMMRNGLTVVALVTLIISLISVYAGLNFTKPIILLDREMNKLKAGKKINPIKVLQEDELGKLAGTFNEMSADLQDKSKRLEQEKEQLNVVLNGIGAGMALVTGDYKFTWMNPMFKELLGEEQQNLPCYFALGDRGEPCRDCPITEPDFNESGERLITLNNPQGMKRIYRHRVFPLDNKIEGEGEFLLFIEDVTEQKELEEKIAQTDKLAALGLMASSFAHEVNNPLATISVYSEDLIDRIGEENVGEEEVLRYLQKIRDNTVRCKKITGNLLNFSRKSTWNEASVDLIETIQNSVSLVEHSLKKNKIALELSVEKDLPLFKGDSLKLMQVLVNLLNNSIDASVAGGSIGISAKRDKNDILLCVSDSGQGIPEEILPRVFDPFYTTKPAGKGTGLGLSVCYGIIQQFGGSISLSSEKGKGTLAEIRLPAHELVKEEVR